MRGIMKSIGFISYVLIFVFSFCSLAMENDFNFWKEKTRENYEKQIPGIMIELNKLKKEGKKLRLIIGRRNNEKHSELPGEDEENIIWVYTDINRMFTLKDLKKPFIWMNFDSLEQVKLIDDQLFEKIWFDWSVLKFFDHFDDILPEIKRILEENGEFIVPAGNQEGMRLAVGNCSLIMPHDKYPLRMTQKIDQDEEVFSMMSEKQQEYLDEVFGKNNSKLVKGDEYPPAPCKKKDLNHYFIVTKKPDQNY